MHRELSPQFVMVHCSKNDVQGVLRKLIAMHVLKEETWRQDNQYGNVMACLKINKREADSLVASKQPIVMPQLVTGSRQSGSSSATAAPVPAKKGRQAAAIASCLLAQHACMTVCWALQMMCVCRNIDGCHHAAPSRL